MDNNKMLKKYELGILDEFDKICKKHNIKYYLAFGTLLGAVRHKGFIPWDDDIDIHMTINDLEKFKEICKTELPKDYYIQDKLTDKYYYNYWTKLGLENTTWMPKDHIVNCKYGICIDIFPIFIGKDTEKDKKRIEKYTKLMLRTSSKYYVLNTKKETYSWYKKTFHRLVPNFLNNYMYKRAIKKLSPNYDDFDYYVVSSISLNRNIYFDKKMIAGKKTLEFENRKLSVPNNTHEYLKTFYDDYMTPPPKKERYGHDLGDSIIYDFKNSYKKYLGDKNDKS